MFEVQHINSRVRRMLGRIFQERRDYTAYSIWNFCPMHRWDQAKSLLQSCSVCRTELFPVVFWVVVLLSLCGAGTNFYELMQVWSCPYWKLNMWRQRHFYVLSYWMLRKARLFGSSINLIAWFMLVYGILTISPAAMSPWILVTSLVLSVEWFMWSFEVITGRLAINLQTLLSLVLHVFFFGMVCCVKSVFEVALADHMEHSLRII
ncbi:uncharacterized protein LOC108045459 [Drosophila rhopaloa]|uniref:Uncharacterized protein LOC108045459 n=1 Tax=Drosophila rhopaloa TaxID=1041015 RepID=A0A6P4EYR1_DRORH|nr:uncharacterized protein LOC108045459 [Drosophila rhopaloa]